MMSIPRDLWVTIADTGDKNRVNSAYNAGPSRLIRTIKDNLGIPIHHYVEVNFATFGALVGAVGGIDVTVEHPAIDHNSGLDIRTSGKVTLDPGQALAYVRSRHYVELIDGKEVPDRRGDIGRQQRQQMFMRSVMAKVGATRNPLTMWRISGTLSHGVHLDDDLSFWDAVRLARRLAGLDPASLVLPTDLARIEGKSVLRLRKDEAQPVLDQLR